MANTELAINAVEKKAKDDVAQAATDHMRTVLRRIPSLLVRQAVVTHSWHKFKAYADDHMAYTLLVPTQPVWSIGASRMLVSQVRQTFKELGDPMVHWHKKGNILAIGFNTGTAHLQQHLEIFGP